jgi:hypothetical protein
MAEAEFFMVWRDDGSVPTFRHQNDVGARKEAVRLARLNPGKKFYTLRATESFLVPAPEVVCEKLSDEMPF